MIRLAMPRCDHLLLWPKLKLLPIVWWWRWKRRRRGRIRNTLRKICDFQFFRSSDHGLDNNSNWYNSNGHQACPMNWRNCASPCMWTEHLDSFRTLKALTFTIANIFFSFFILVHSTFCNGIFVLNLYWSQFLNRIFQRYLSCNHNARR